MLIHDWTRVEAGVFHAFHHGWIEEMSRALNSGVLPPGFYALPEQHAAGFGPDVLTLEAPTPESPTGPEPAPGGGVSLLLTPPKARITAETDLEFYRRKQTSVVVRHASGDRMVAVIEVVSPGNKSGRAAIQSFLEKAAELLDRRIHLLILDLHPPGPRDPQGIHGLLWEYLTGQEQAALADKPLTFAAYESALTVRAYVDPVAVGDRLPDMPLFLEPGAHVLMPLEATYARAFGVMPLRWRAVVES